MSKDARLQGKLAFEHNMPMSSCEYPAGSTLRAEWMEGWTEAQNMRPGGGTRPVEPKSARG